MAGKAAGSSAGRMAGKRAGQVYGQMKDKVMNHDGMRVVWEEVNGDLTGWFRVEMNEVVVKMKGDITFVMRDLISLEGAPELTFDYIELKKRRSFISKSLYNLYTTQLNSTQHRVSTTNTISCCCC